MQPCTSEKLYQTAVSLLAERGVTMDDITEIVMFLQNKYIPEITPAMCRESVEAVLRKREVQNALLTGIQLDLLAKDKKLLSPLQEIIEMDEPLYGIDEVMALAILNLYGTIGFTNYGYVDKLKYGVLAKLNDKQYGVHTFLDDLVGAIAASASSRLAHRHFGRELTKEILQGGSVTPSVASPTMQADLLQCE